MPYYFMLVPAFTCEAAKRRIPAVSSALSPILEDGPFSRTSLIIIEVLKLIKLSVELKEGANCIWRVRARIALRTRAIRSLSSLSILSEMRTIAHLLPIPSCHSTSSLSIGKHPHSDMNFPYQPKKFCSHACPANICRSLYRKYCIPCNTCTSMGNKYPSEDR